MSFSAVIKLTRLFSLERRLKRIQLEAPLSRVKFNFLNLEYFEKFTHLEIT